MTYKASLIDDESVRAFRQECTGFNLRDLAKKYGISVQYAWSIAYYRTRKAAGPPRDTVTYHIPLPTKI